MEALLFILLFPTKKGLNSVYAVPFPHKLHFLKLVQTSSKFRLSFVCAKNEARQDFSSCYSPCCLTRKIHVVWFQFCPSSEDRANFPFVCPPLNVEAVLASVLWEEKEKWLLRIGRYKGHRRPLGIGQPLKSWGRLMLVHNSFKHHLEVETWFPVDTHR